MIEALRSKMKYLRGAGKPKFSKKITAISGEPPKKKRKQDFRVSQPPAAPPPGEDEESFKRHQKFLQLELKKVNPNQTVIGDVMERTFTFRHQDIIQRAASVTETLKTYPSLRRLDQVIFTVYHVFQSDYLNYFMH